MTDKLPTPIPPTPLIRTQGKPRRRSSLKLLGLGLFCFGLSFLGAWSALAAGLVDNDDTMTEKRSVVSQEGEVVADVAERLGPSVVSACSSLLQRVLSAYHASKLP